ncbi:MAG: flavodoxin [Lachnospiraceae bacterium]|nr:flavodoxin [Lachnospiraceae bacterium]
MKQGIIVYQSKYGATKKYADWLCEATGFDCVETPKAVWSEVMRYETVLLCGGIYASGIAGLSFLKKNVNKFNNKNIAVLCVGASPYDEGALDQIRVHNLKGELRAVPLFYGRGAWNESRMTWVDRNLCRMLQRAVAKKDFDSCEPWMKALLASTGQVCDWTDRKYLIPLLEYLGRTGFCG